MSELLDPELQRQILAAFAAEAEERLQAITDHLLALEKQPEAGQVGQLLKDIFREAHTLKGGARVLGLEGIEKVTHHLETLFGLLQNGKLLPRREIFDLVYQALDVIRLLMREATTGTPAQLDITELCTRLAEAQNPVPARVAPPPEPRTPVAVTPQVPAARKETPPVPVQAPPPQSKEIARPAASEVVPRLADETVRVAIAKLDALMAQVGELQVARSGADHRLTEVRSLFDLCETWEARWRQFRSAYRRHEPVIAGQAAPEPARAVPRANRTANLPAFLELNAGNLRAVHAQLADLRRGLEEDSRRMAQILADLQDDVRRVRMLPIATVFDPFPRMVRDLARDLGKEVTLTMHGGENEMDRSLLEQIKGPLLHLLRNAIDHGLEVPPARLAAGKPGAGTITLSAAQRGSSILIELADDGAGIDVARVKASAVQKGWLTPEAAAAMGDREGLWLIFRSGLSTRAAVTDLSGRGVGLDVVHEQVARLNGLIDVDSRPGQGTRFSLRLPLTVATTLCLLARAGRQMFALPITNVLRIVRVRPGDIGRAGGSEVIVVDDRPITLSRLADALDLADPAAPVLGQGLRPSPSPGAGLTAVIMGAAEKRAALLVDDVVSTREIVIKKLPPPLFQVPLLAGVTILGTGEVVMVPNVAALLRSAGTSGPRVLAAQPAPAPVAQRRPVILVADDSITSRTLEKNILEAAGYAVRVATDGQEAWDLLQEGGYDLLISDGEMPRLDGFGLTRRVRADERWKDLPVILVTSLDAPEERERGIRAGADGYVVKGAFDQEKLLAAIAQLI